MIEKVEKPPEVEAKNAEDSVQPALTTSCTGLSGKWFWWICGLILLLAVLSAWRNDFVPNLHVFSEDERANNVTQVGVQVHKPKDTLPSGQQPAIAVKKAEGPSSVTIDGVPSESEEPMGDEGEDNANAAANAAPASALKTKTDIKALETSIENLDHRIKAIEDVQAQDQGRGQRILSGFAAFIPLEFEAMSGRSFGASYAALQDVAVADPKLATLIAPLESVAAKGAPSSETLLRRYETLERAARLAAAKAEATTWLDRLRVALMEVVNIRRTDVGALEEKPWLAIANALQEGRLEEAATGIDSLPPAAKAVLTPVAEAARARAVVEGSLRDIGLYLAAQGKGG